MALVYGTSNKGKPTLIHSNFEYLKEIKYVNGTISWRCRRYKQFKCKARLMTSDDRVVREPQVEHTHSGNSATSLARKAVGEMKECMTNMTSTPSSSQAAVKSKLEDHVLMALPKRATLNRALKRHRNKVNKENNGCVAFPALPKDLLFEIPESFVDMVLYDSGPGENRMIILGCEMLLDGLARADVWLADGTFKIVPGIFYLLYSIHFNFGHGLNPVGLYCLLTNKRQDTYEKILQELIPLANPKNILVDFEKAPMNVFSAAYPNATVTGCYFHLCQSVIRKVNEIGLKLIYENNEQVRDYVRCLLALAFIPQGDVEAFELLADTQPGDIEHLDELTSFFEHTYLRGRRQRGRGDNYGPAIYHIPTWNQYTAGTDGIARTTNSVEGWHYGLQSLFLCHHPTVWTFLTGIKKDIQTQKTRFMQGSTGVHQPSTKKYRELNDRVKRAVCNYGKAEILLYLSSLAYLSHQ